MLDLYALWNQICGAFAKLDSWEDWSDLGTIVGATANAAFLIALIFQIRQGRKTVEESGRSAHAAQRAAKEAMRGRIDEQAPRIIALLEKPVFHGLRDERGFVTDLNQEFVMPRMKDVRLLSIVKGRLVNEGKGSARVRLDGNGARFLTRAEVEDDPFMFEITSTGEERILRPGESIPFAWSDGHSLEDWVDAYNNPSPPNPRGASFLVVTIRDYLEDGVLDHIPLEMSGRPIVPVDGDEGRWMFGDDAAVVVTSYPVHRTYRKEGWKGVTLPWEKIYKEWNESQQALGNRQPEISVTRRLSVLSVISRLLTGR